MMIPFVSIPTDNANYTQARTSVNIIISLRTQLFWRIFGLEVTMEEITVAEAAKLKGCSKTRILQLIRKSHLPARRVGPVFMIPKYAVEAYQLPGRGKGSRRKRAKINPNSNDFPLD